MESLHNQTRITGNHGNCNYFYTSGLCIKCLSPFSLCVKISVCVHACVYMYVCVLCMCMCTCMYVFVCV